MKAAKRRRSEQIAALLCQIFYVFMECFPQTQNKTQARTPQTLIRTKQLKQNSSEDTPVD